MALRVKLAASDKCRADFHQIKKQMHAAYVCHLSSKETVKTLNLWQG